MLNLKWWNFILMGLSPLSVIKKDFKELLSKELFLCLIEEEFKKIGDESNLTNIDALYSIQSGLKSANISNISAASSIFYSESPQEIIDKLNNHNETKELLKKNQIWLSTLHAL